MDVKGRKPAGTRSGRRFKAIVAALAACLALAGFWPASAAGEQPFPGVWEAVIPDIDFSDLKRNRPGERLLRGEQACVAPEGGEPNGNAEEPGASGNEDHSAII